MLRKFLTVALAVMVLLTVSACGNKDADNNQSSSQVSVDNSSSSQASEIQNSSNNDSSTVSDISAQLVDGVYTDLDGAFKMTIPEGWEISNDNGIVMFKTPEYPNDPDSISLMTTVKTDSFDSLTKEDFRENFASIFSDVTINTFEKTTVDEFSAYIVEYTYKLSSIEIKHTEVLVDASDSTYTFTLNDDDGDKAELFEEVIESIDFTE